MADISLETNFQLFADQYWDRVEKTTINCNSYRSKFIDSDKYFNNTFQQLSIFVKLIAFKVVSKIYFNNIQKLSV